jgi:hypothetical protein
MYLRFFDPQTVGDATLPVILGVRTNAMATKKHTVKFAATKTVKKPTEVKFKTKSGEKVKFKAEKPVKQRVGVQFKAKDK